MKNNILIALRLTLVCLVFFCGVYTLIVFGISRLVPQESSFAKTTSGFYQNVGQSFTSNKYFNTRPSAVDYNAAGSGGSNKGPSNPDYLEEVEKRIDSFLINNPGVSRAEIPSDLVTASGSGLDPDISVQAAKVQAKRIAASRKIDLQKIEMLIKQETQKPLLGLFGTEKINVLKINLALDKI